MTSNPTRQTNDGDGTSEQEPSSGISAYDWGRSILQHNQLLQLLMDTIPTRVFWKDRDSAYMGCNARFAGDAGLSGPDAIVGLNDYDLSWGASEADRYRADDKAVMTSGIAKLNYEEPQTRSSVDGIWLSTSKIPLRDSDGSIIGVLGTYEDITERKVAEQNLVVSLREKDILLKELYHRTKNNMQVICSLLNLKAMANPQLEETFSDIGHQIQSMSLVHQKLYESQNLATLDLGDYLADLAAHLLESTISKPLNIELYLDVETVPVSVDVAIPCGLVVCELLSNCVKHAFSGNEQNQISIKLRKDGNDGLELTVSDNGEGVGHDFDFRSNVSMGLESVIGIVEHQLRGTISLDTRKGTSWRICIEKRDGTPRI